MRCDGRFEGAERKPLSCVTPYLDAKVRLLMCH